MTRTLAILLFAASALAAPEAVGLAERGVASLRYDKRGIGASAAAMSAEVDMRFTDYVDDVVAWCRRLREDGRFDRVVIVGHSEGSQIGASAARLAGADGFVSLCGPGEAPAAILRAQLAAQLPPAMYAEADSAIGLLERGELVAEPPAALFALFRPSVQPYLISWLANDPAAEQSASYNDPGLALTEGLVDAAADFIVGLAE